MFEEYLSNEVIKEFYNVSKEDKLYKAADDLSKFILDVEKKDDILIAIIKGHLLIENNLEDLLENYIERYSKLNIKYFSEKLNLCYALDLIDEYAYKLLKGINKIRNEYGHDLNFEFKKENLEKWESILSKEDKTLYQKLIEPYEDSEIFNKVTCYLQCAFMKVYNRKITIHDIKRDKAIKWYNELLDDALKYVDNEREEYK